jgi:3-oxoacyl-[acyl-carrier-protein] synthase II
MTTADQAEALSPTKRALLAIKDLQAKVEALEQALDQAKHEPIAIVGMGCRFPGADNPAAFWQLLRDGSHAITDIPGDRWDVDRYYSPDPDAAGKMVTRYGGFVPDLYDFDAPFFRIAPREAISLDPQQRLLLEVSWEALEHGGFAPDRLINTQTGVFVGICSIDYWQRLLSRDRSEIDAYLTTGNTHSIASGRLSYLLGLTGPSLSIDTACSSSLVAVHLACQSLRQRDCDLALAGGVNRILSPESTINFSKARMLSPDGHCRSFDADANGFVRSEGCGMIVLKRLSDAIAQRDMILATILGSAVNHDGRSSGLTVPNGPAQQAVIRQALQRSRIQPSQVSYIEAHGTGTSLGDPIEVNALGDVFGDRSPSNPLLIGSVKTNIGHTEAAAGMAGLIKVVLSLQHGEIPANLHFQTPNPQIRWDELPIAVPTRRVAWEPRETPRIAGVSAFGFNGSNAHVVLGEGIEGRREKGEGIEGRRQKAEGEEGEKGRGQRAEGRGQRAEGRGQRAEGREQKAEGRGERLVHVLTLSARTEVALKQLASRYVEHFSSHADLEVADVCFTANTGRSHFNYRLAIVAASIEELREKLTRYLAGQAIEGVVSGKALSNPPSSELVVNVGAEAVPKSLYLLLTDEFGTQLASLRLNQEDWRMVLHPLAQHYVQGASVNWVGFDRPYLRRKVVLPTYPFQRQRYAIERD